MCCISALGAEAVACTRPKEGRKGGAFKGNRGMIGLLSSLSSVQGSNYHLAAAKEELKGVAVLCSNVLATSTGFCLPSVSSAHSQIWLPSVMTSCSLLAD